MNRRRVAPVLTTHTELEGRIRSPATRHRNLDELTDALDINRRERIAVEDALFPIVAQELTRVISGETERHLGQVVRTEGEEIGVTGDLSGRQRTPWNFNHRADQGTSL